MLTGSLKPSKKSIAEIRNKRLKNTSNSDVFSHLSLKLLFCFQICQFAAWIITTIVTLHMFYTSSKNETNFEQILNTYAHKAEDLQSTIEKLE